MISPHFLYFSPPSGIYSPTVQPIEGTLDLVAYLLYIFFLGDQLSVLFAPSKDLPYRAIQLGMVWDRTLLQGFYKLPILVICHKHLVPGKYGMQLPRCSGIMKPRLGF